MDPRQCFTIYISGDKCEEAIAFKYTSNPTTYALQNEGRWRTAVLYSCIPSFGVWRPGDFFTQ
jgi:hypothetical protein